MKTVSLIGRRDDLDRQAFRDYYERRHVPLAIGHFPFTRYIRNHVVRCSADLPAFDVMPEFEFDDIAAVRAVLATPAGEVVRADEARFMGDVRYAAVAAPSIVAEGAQPGRRVTVFLKGEGGAADKAGSIREWVTGFAPDSGVRASIDILSSFEGAPFPADALVSFWTSCDPSVGAPKGFSRLGTAEFEIEETDPCTLTSR